MKGNGLAPDLRIPPAPPAPDPTSAPLDRRNAYGLAAGSGALLAMAFPVIDWGPLAWVALVPLLWAALGRGAGAAFRTAWVAGFVFFVATLYWLVITIGTYTNLSPLVSVGPLVLLCGFLALGFGLFAAGCEWARRHRIDVALAAPPLWVLIEWIRTYILGGFPWVSLGYSQYRATYLIQFVEFTGVYGLSALVVLVNVVIYGAVDAWRVGASASTRRLFLLTGLLVVLVAWGYWRVHELAELPAEGSLRVGFIQGNVAQDQKWDPVYQDTIIDHYERLTSTAVAEGAELVVWPETAAPFFFQESGRRRDDVLELARTAGAPLL
jgi:apolipoprotein N-acyltransferase